MTSSSEPLQVVALISGGKDSMFSMLHCLANGHNVVALGNLYPQTKGHEDVEEDGDEWDQDTNSLMYQTAGHHLIPLFAQALDLPLYRQEIVGDANDTSKTYQGSSVRVTESEEESNSGARQGQDETEALRTLLSEVMTAHPEINAVCSGAILSSYQRTRIESVAVRLGLTPLAYLWQYPILPPAVPSSLLEDMRAVGLDARIIKVASGGLEEDLLWKNLLEYPITRKVEKAMARFGGSVLGEGGEYETMVLNGPDPIWKKRMEIKLTDMQSSRESDGTAWLTFKRGCGNHVPSQCGDVKHSLNEVRIPELWDKQSRLLLEKSRATKMSETQNFDSTDKQQHDELRSEAVALLTGDHSAISHLSEPFNTHNSNTELETVFIKRQGITNGILNLTGSASGSSENATRQMTDISRKLLDALEEISYPTTSIVFTTIMLQSMSDFAAVNTVYARLFTKPNPPARVTIAAPLPTNVKVVVSIILDNGALRDALHVQSRSYWAPANIGPYSQAVSVHLHENQEDRLVYVAGQIPLVPSTMKVLPNANIAHEESEIGGFLERSLLSLQHVWRIGQEMRVSWWAGAIAFVTELSNAQDKADAAWAHWQSVHQVSLWEEQNEEDESFDIWDSKYGAQSILISGVEDRSLPDFSKMSNLAGNTTASTVIPGFFAVQAEALPRNCDIEWQGLGLVCRRFEGIEEAVKGAWITTCSILSAGRSISYVEIPLGQGSSSSLRQSLVDVLDWADRRSLRDCHPICTVYTPYTPAVSDLAVQIVPCHNVWGRHARALLAAVTVDCVIERQE